MNTFSSLQNQRKQLSLSSQKESEVMNTFSHQKNDYHSSPIRNPEVMKFKGSKVVNYNKTGYEINDSKLRIEINKNIKRIGSYSVTSKYYNFLNRKNLSEIKDGEFRVSLSSFGKKFILFLTKINDVNYNVFINKKNELMIKCDYKFINDLSDGDLYDGTLLDGELVKNDNNQWIFIVNDIAYYKGKNIVIKQFDERLELIDNILRNQLCHDEYELNDEEYRELVEKEKVKFDKELEEKRANMIIDDEYYDEEEEEVFKPPVRVKLNMTYIIRKKYFSYEYIQDISNRYRNSLNYKNSGLYFRNVHNFSDNYLYIFPECRTDHQVLHALPENIIKNGIDSSLGSSSDVIDRNIINKNLVKKEIEKKDIKEENEDDDIFGEVENIVIKENKEKKDDKQNNEIENTINKPSDKLNRKYCKFLIKPTNKPEVYELYCRSVDKHVEKYSLAGVNSVSTSKFLKDIFKNYNNDPLIDITTLVKEKKALYVECNYHKQFKKWVPYKKCEDMDHHTFINEVTILLDNSNDTDDDSDDD